MSGGNARPVMILSKCNFYYLHGIFFWGGIWFAWHGVFEGHKNTTTNLGLRNVYGIFTSRGRAVWMERGINGKLILDYNACHYATEIIKDT